MRRNSLLAVVLLTVCGSVGLAEDRDKPATNKGRTVSGLIKKVDRRVAC
jgi:hypothetical protein